MRRRGFALSKKTERWMHRKRGSCDIPLGPDIESEKITKFVIQGQAQISSDGRFIGVGEYDSDSGYYKIPLHVHGKNYLSGTDFAAIHSSKNVCSNFATQGDQYMFIPAANSSGVTLIDSAMIKFKENTAYTIAFSVKFLTATKPRDLKISINYTDGSSYIPLFDTYVNEFAECISTDPTKTVKDIVSYVGDKQITVYLMSQFGIYEGVYTNHTDVHEAYVGERYEILLRSPLYAIDFSKDELDLLLGKVTRKIKIQTVNSASEITKTETEGVFEIALDKQARPGSRIISRFSALTDESDEGICLSEDGDGILFKPEGNLTDVSKVKEYLEAEAFDIAYVMNEPEIENTDAYRPDSTGKSFIDVLTTVPPKRCFIEYH